MIPLGNGLREAVANHVLANLLLLRKNGALGRLAVQHRRELARALNAALRRRLQLARPLPLLSQSALQMPTASTNGDSPRSARSVASSRFAGVCFDFFVLFSSLCPHGFLVLKHFAFCQAQACLGPAAFRRPQMPGLSWRGKAAMQPLVPYHWTARPPRQQENALLSISARKHQQQMHNV